jgi:hypothetical protein
MRDELLKRLPASAAEERELITQAFGITGTVREKAAAIRADGRLSETGKADDTRALARGAPLAHLRQIKARAAAMAADVANARKAVQLPEPDRTDLSAEMRRAELRSFVRGLPQEEKLRFVLGNEAAATAVLDQLPAISGLNDDLFDRVKQERTERLFGSQLAEIEKREAAVEVISSAVEIASSQFRRESGLGEDEIGDAE